MADEKSENGIGTGRPFQLRPSILGSGTSFSSFAKDCPSKGFALRPSALSAAAESIITTPKTETRKRTMAENVEDTEDDSIEESNKKTKVMGCQYTDSLKLTANKSTEEGLNDVVRHPTGIGTFGFANTVTNSDLENNNKDNNIPVKVPDYFRQGLENGGKKLEFVFGAASNDGGASNAVDGFKSLSNKTSDDSNHINKNTEGQDNHKLLENADEYQKSNLENKQRFEEVQQYTGEEGENHVLQVICKLHEFNNKTKSWQEKGRGTLRLNDISQSEGLFQSRIVFRTQGTNIVLLNTMLWPEMCCEKVREKNVRISGIAPGSHEVKLFLLNCGPKDCQKMFTAIERRIVALKRNKDHYPSVKHTSTLENSDNVLPNNQTITETTSNIPSSAVSDEQSKDDVY